MTFDLFMLGLMVVSTITGFVTEAVKTIFNEHNWKYCANTLAGVCAFVVSAVLGVCYVLFTGTAFNAQVIIMLITLMVMSWLCAMVGYDKVIQSLNQFKNINKEG
jgi:ABC-type thiamin/hydroxymethylpyrimidine transport system permease subunit